MDEQYLDVLKEIKDLMDKRIGEKLKGGVSVQKVSVQPVEEGGPEPMEEEKSKVAASLLAPEEEEELQKLRGMSC